MDTARAADLAERLAGVRERIGRACAAADRDPAEVVLIVVTKFFPAQDAIELVRLGVSDFGENRDQEAAPKVEELRAAAGGGPRVHFIGRLQTNKAGSVARYADAVHSVDRARLVRALEKGAVAAGRDLDVLVQVSLEEGGEVNPGAPPEARGGAAPADVPALAAAVAESERLRLRGVMAVAPLAEAPEAAFARLREVLEQVRATYPEAGWVSAGMSGDLEAAIAAGATHVRVGSAILGDRPQRG